MPLKNLLHRRSLSFFAYVVLATIIGYFFLAHYTPSLGPGQQAPLENAIVSLSGAHTSFKNLHQKKILVINFWATWCPPCQEELPILSKMATEFPEAVFIGAIVDSKKEDVLALKKRFHLDYFLGFVGSESTERFQASTLPTTYIVDELGIILWAKSGALKEESFRVALKSALAHPQRTSTSH